MTKQDKNKAINKLENIQRILNYEGHKIDEYKDKQKIAYEIETIVFKTLNLPISEPENFEKVIERRTNAEWTEVTISYIDYCKEEIIKEYKLHKLHKQIISFSDDEILQNFYKTIKKIMKIKDQPKPSKQYIDKTMTYYNDLFQSKQITEHKRNILQNLITTKEIITYE